MSDGKGSRKPIVDHEKFIDLMRVASEEPDVRGKLNSILKLDSFNRRSILNTWLDDLKLQGAPVFARSGGPIPRGRHHEGFNRHPFSSNPHTHGNYRSLGLT